MGKGHQLTYNGYGFINMPGKSRKVDEEKKKIRKAFSAEFFRSPVYESAKALSVAAYGAPKKGKIDSRILDAISTSKQNYFDLMCRTMGRYKSTGQIQALDERIWDVTGHRFDAVDLVRALSHVILHDRIIPRSKKEEAKLLEKTEKKLVKAYKEIEKQLRRDVEQEYAELIPARFSLRPAH
jgi:hypothetical protein